MNWNYIAMIIVGLAIGLSLRTFISAFTTGFKKGWNKKAAQDRLLYDMKVANILDTLRNLSKTDAATIRFCDQSHDNYFITRIYDNTFSLNISYIPELPPEIAALVIKT